ncbi:MAG: hypothetical protein R3258_10155 [Acidimicrobiia bacterium]|nr:hypothetical protein [Acidimicrobiia bacterium]
MRRVLRAGVVAALVAALTPLALPAWAFPAISDQQFCTNGAFSFTVSVSSVEPSEGVHSIGIFPDSGAGDQQFIQFNWDPNTGEAVDPSGVFQIGDPVQRWIIQDSSGWTVTDDGGGNWTLSGTLQHGTDPIPVGHLFTLQVRRTSLPGAHLVSGIPAEDCEPAPPPAPDFCESGRIFGAFHSQLAQAGAIGGDGHKPGSHHGFAACIHEGDFNNGMKKGPKPG